MRMGDHQDSGYTRSAVGSEAKLSKHELGSNVGVYAGVMYQEYQLFGAEESVKGNPTALWSSASSIANRVSYFFNFQGPSLAVDTMCSSSLTALHLACEALQNGSCSVAIAGGVNVSVHPNKYLMLSQGRFVSSKGRCESFGEGGEGYVPGEGVGAVLLKPLSQAQADGEQDLWFDSRNICKPWWKNQRLHSSQPQSTERCYRERPEESGRKIRRH